MLYSGQIGEFTGRLGNVMSVSRFEELMSLFLDDEITEDGLAELHHLVMSSKQHRESFQQETRLATLLHDSSSEQLELQSLIPASSSHLPPSISVRVIAASVMAIAALIFVLVGSQVLLNRSESIGEFVRFSGKVEIFRHGQVQAVTSDSKLASGDSIRCGSQSQTMIQLKDRSILTLSPLTELALDADQRKVRLIKGEAFFEIAPRKASDQPFEVATESSTIAVLGTVFSLNAGQHTELKVYEGNVSLTRNHDHAQVNVGSEQMTSTRDLKVEQLADPTQIELRPTDDLTVDRGRINATGPRLKVEGKNRTVFFRFDLPEFDDVVRMRLRLSQNVDAGRGTLRFFQGSHSVWDEYANDPSHLPKKAAELGRRSGVVGQDQTILINLSPLDYQPGPLTIVMTLDETGENDIWFGAKESESPPLLMIDRAPK